MQAAKDIGSASSVKSVAYRYGREEFLAMYTHSLPIPDSLKDMSILCIRQQLPMSFLPITDDEQISLLQCVNSAPCLKSVQAPLSLSQSGKRGGATCQERPRGIGRGKSVSDSSFRSPASPEARGQRQAEAALGVSRAEAGSPLLSSVPSQRAGIKKGEAGSPAELQSKNSSGSDGSTFDDLRPLDFGDNYRKSSNEEENIVNSCVDQKSFCSSDNCPESFISGNGRSLASLSNPCVHTNTEELSNGRQKDVTSRVQTSFRSGSGQYRDGASTDQSNQSNLKIDFAVKEGSQSSVVTNKQMHEMALKYKLPPASKRWYYKDPNEIIQGPFSDKEMEEWFVAGYFTTKLLLREGTAGDFTMLGTLIKKFGKFPFISNNEDMTPSTAFDKLLPLSFANFEEESTSAFGF